MGTCCESIWFGCQSWSHAGELPSSSSAGRSGFCWLGRWPSTNRAWVICSQMTYPHGLGDIAWRSSYSRELALCCSAGRTGRGPLPRAIWSSTWAWVVTSFHAWNACLTSLTTWEGEAGLSPRRARAATSEPPQFAGIGLLETLVERKACQHPSANGAHGEVHLSCRLAMTLPQTDAVLVRVAARVGQVPAQPRVPVEPERGREDLHLVPVLDG